MGLQVFVAVPAGAGEGPSRSLARARWPTSCPSSTRSSRSRSGLAFPHAWFGVVATATVALSLAGFAVHTSHEHARMAAAGLGRPHYEPDVAREAGATHGLLFFDDDEGYELAHDPAATASHGIEAVRVRGDDHDRLLFDLLGPPADPPAPLGPHRTRACRRGRRTGGDTWRFEAEADYPPVAVSDPSVGRAEVVDALGTCASDAHALAVAPAGAAEASVTLELPVPRRRPAARGGRGS